MTRHIDETHRLSTGHEARTRHNEAHTRRFGWSDEAHHEAHPTHTPTRHNGSPPLGGAVPRGFGRSESSARRSLFFPPLPEIALSGLRREFSPRVAELGGSA
jgi:hypothetical protein